VSLGALTVALCLISALMAALLLVRGLSPFAKRLRVALHFLSMVGFCCAGWLLARAGHEWGGLGVVAFAFVWTGLFWVLSIRWRLVRRPPRARLATAVRTDPAPKEGGDAGRETLEPENEAVLARLLGMARVKVSDIATPREEIVFADCATGAAGALDRMRESGHLRIPMVDGSLDRVVGIVHAKDIVSHAVGRKPSPPLKSLMRRPLFVTSDRPVSGLLETFRSQRSHLAIVVDVYGRTLGVVTRGDLFRHLTGGARPA